MIALLKLGLALALVGTVLLTFIGIEATTSDDMWVLWLAGGFLAAISIGMCFVFIAIHDRLDDAVTLLKQTEERAAKLEREDWQRRQQEDAATRARQ